MVNKEFGTKKYQTFIQSLLVENIEDFTKKLSDYLIFTISFHNLGEKDKEKSYHLFLLGLVACLKDTHIILSNRESGHGRYDIKIIPKSKSKHAAFILEFKRSETSNNLEKLANDALNQIKQKLYSTEINEFSHIESVVKIGLAFCGKEVKLAYEKLKIK